MAINSQASNPGDGNPDAQVFSQQAYAIADWWVAHAVDEAQGGFYGEIAHDNRPRPNADKCIILNARILWFFSEFARWSGDAAYKRMAERAFDYTRDRFVDAQHGGVLWMLNAAGECLDGRKHVYAQAFAIYAFSAYYRLTGDARALSLASDCFDLLETHGRDRVHGGYFEAFAQDWGPLADVRLSAKEDNYPKTMNTHLHVLEAYSGLHSALWRSADRSAPVTDLRQRVGDRLLEVLRVYCDRIVNRDTGHVRLFLSEQWQDHSHAISFGHDIESSWLIDKAIHSLAEAGISAQDCEDCVAILADTALREGLLPSGSMRDEYDLNTGHESLTAWWVQVEAMVGFANLWVQSGDEAYRNAALAIWRYTQVHYLDEVHGEWHWFSRHQVPPEQSEYKIGAWKAPYHNGRAMMMMNAFLKMSPPQSRQQK